MALVNLLPNISTFVTVMAEDVKGLIDHEAARAHFGLMVLKERDIY